MVPFFSQLSGHIRTGDESPKDLHAVSAGQTCSNIQEKHFQGCCVDGGDFLHSFIPGRGQF